MVGSELKEHRCTQEQMASNQRDNTQKMINQLQFFKYSVTLLKNGDRKNYIRGEMPHNVAVLNSFLTYFHSTLKIFRATLYTFCTNIFKTFAPIVNGFLLLSVSRQ